MTKIVLCYGVILGLYFLLHGVHGSEDDLTSKHSNEKHHRRRGDGHSESGIPQDKIFIKSESPLRGRKIHQTAWSKEEANSPDEFKMAEKTTNSWNFKKLYNYLLSAIHKTEEMEQAKMAPSETVMATMRNKIKSEIEARKDPEGGKKGSAVPKSPESRRLACEEDFERSYSERRIENSESSEESDESGEYDESCEEDEDSSSEMYDNRGNKGNTKDKKENGSEYNKDCYEDDESDENSSVKKETGSTNAVKHETTSAKERKQSTSENNQLPGQEVSVLNGTSVTNNQKPINILGKTTGAARIGSKPQITGATPNSKNTVKMNKGGTDIGITPTASSNVHESTVVNLPTTTGLEKSTSDQFIQSKPGIQEKVNINTATESNAHESPTESASTLNANSVSLQKESSDTGTASTTMKGLVTDSKSATRTSPQDNFEVIITAPEFIPISNKVTGNTEVPSNKNTEVKPNMDKILNVPVEVAQVYGGKQSEAQKVSQGNLENQVAKETKSETLLDTTGKTSMGDSIDSMVFPQGNYENMENNPFQRESFLNNGRKDDILEEYNLKNEFIELSDNDKNEFVNRLKDYNTNNQKYDGASQHSAMSQNVEFNGENANQETFDTILEFLYKHSKNPLILSLRNSNQTLF